MHWTRRSICFTSHHDRWEQYLQLSESKLGGCAPTSCGRSGVRRHWAMSIVFWKNLCFHLTNGDNKRRIAERYVQFHLFDNWGTVFDFNDNEQKHPIYRCLEQARFIYELIFIFSYLKIMLTVYLHRSKPSVECFRCFVNGRLSP